MARSSPAPPAAAAATAARSALGGKPLRLLHVDLDDHQLPTTAAPPQMAVLQASAAPVRLTAPAGRLATASKRLISLRGQLRCPPRHQCSAGKGTASPPLCCRRLPHLATWCFLPRFSIVIHPPSPLLVLPSGPDGAEAGPDATPSPAEQQRAEPPAQQQAAERQQQEQQQRRSSAAQPEEEEEERDLFVPILVIAALVGYAMTAAIAWWEYNID